MSLRRRLAALGLALSIAVGGSQALANQELFTELEQEAESARQLELVEPLDVTVKTRDELKQEQLESLDEESPTGDTDDWNAVLVFLGYIEEGEDISRIYNEMMGDQILGYYNSETGEMVVVSSSTEEWSATDKTTFVHETVHALQDQNFGLMDTWGDDETLTDDQYFATLSLIEGDATVAEMIYLVENDLIDQLLAEQEDIDMSSLDDVPFFLLESTYFPYTEGAEFVLAIWQEGGWTAVNDVWENPPTTSEQILHPEKYVDGEGAAPVAIADPLPTFGDDWRLLEYNENGELGIRIFLENGGASNSDATAATEGWGGDSTYIITNDDETAMVWNSTWDTDEDASEYFDTLAETEVNRLGAEREDVDENTVTFATEGWVGEIHRDGNDVTYYLTQSDAAMDLMIESQVGAETRPGATPDGEEPATPVSNVAFWVREV